ncbi:hypothetical protein [Candidatus Nitrospira bockiana]
MRRWTFQGIAAMLAMCLLVLSGILYPQTVAHAAHHAHHQTATHGTVLCTWMCAAGQSVETADLVLPAQLTVVTVAPPRPRHSPDESSPATPTTRGPPGSSL